MSSVRLVLARIVRRLLWAVPTVLIVTFFVFLLLDLAPGDAARSVAGDQADEQVVQEVRKELRLDDPLPVRYVRWVGDAVQGDLGTSLLSRQSVTDELFGALPKTLSLAFVAIVMAMLLAFILGAAPVFWPRAAVDRACTLLSALTLSLPSFWIALIFTTVFALDRSWFPALGYVRLFDDPWGWVDHLILPGLALGLVTAGELARQIRGSLLDVLSSDYALAARAKGLPHRRVVLKHGLKNAAVPVVTVLGVRVAGMLGGTVIIENIFLINGIGQLTVTAVNGKDFPVVLGVVLIATVLVLLINLLIDLTYTYFNPKLRQE